MNLLNAIRVAHSTFINYPLKLNHVGLAGWTLIQISHLEVNINKYNQLHHNLNFHHVLLERML